MKSNPTEILVALPTSFDAQGRFLPQPFGQLISDLVEGGVDGFLACGSMGLGPLLEHEEFEAVIAAARQALKARETLLIAGCGMPSLPQTLRRIELAERAGANAICVTAPFFFKYGDGELASFLEAVLDATALDVFVYEVPIRTGNSFTPQVLQRLLGRPNLRGIKVTNFDMEYLRRIAADFGDQPGLSLYNGINRHMPAALAMGYRGFIDGLFALEPHAARELAEAYLAGRTDEANLAHAKLLAIDDFLGREGVWPAFTALLNAQGYAGDWLRAPQVRPDSALRQRAEQFARELWPQGRGVVSSRT